MYLALVRHGDSVSASSSGGLDAARYLSEQGRSQAKALGGLLEAQDILIARAWSSSLVRAVQTTELVLANLQRSNPSLQTLSALAGGSVGEVLHEASMLEAERTLQGALLLVGHQPQMGQLLATLLGDRRGIPFHTGMVAVVEGQPQPGACQLIGIGRPETGAWHTELGPAL